MLHATGEPVPHSPPGTHLPTCFSFEHTKLMAHSGRGHCICYGHPSSGGAVSPPPWIILDNPSTRNPRVFLPTSPHIPSR